MLPCLSLVLLDSWRRLCHCRSSLKRRRADHVARFKYDAVFSPSLPLPLPLTNRAGLLTTMKATLLGVATAVLASLVAAQQPLYEQCGGSGWTGGTTCVAGTYCQ